MRGWRRLTAAVAVCVMAGVPVQAAPVGPVVNGAFELAAPGKDQVCAVFGDAYIDVLPNHDPWLARVYPCETGAVKALHWSTSKVTQFRDVDGDGDREAVIDGSIPPDPGVGASHNMWQAYPSPHQAYTPNAEALRFRVESGVIPAGAFVQLSLSTSPREEPSPYLVVFLNCSLTFTALTPDEAGLVSVDPVTGTFRSRHGDCDLLEAAWNGSGPEQRREILGRTRIVQLSFWSFQAGAPVVIDDVELVNATTVAEELADIEL